jgi:hypothetical protein
MEEINKTELLGFIAKAHRNTYAAPKEIKQKHKCKTPILPEHKDYHFTEGDWSYHDSYAGSEWAPGREVVFFKDEPVWCMAYQGQHNPDYSSEFFQEETFPFLKKALSAMTEDMPFRGFPNFEEGDFKYTFTLEGDYQYFKGKETITHKGIEVFFQDVMGELIK